MVRDRIFAVAPMMDWTDRHCRFFHRQLSRRALLFTEMVTAEATIRGDRERLLGFSPAERPLILQLGGSEPARLAEAARIGEAFGYDGINLNVGCPSDRVQSGTFGACLMREPALVGRLVGAMRGAVAIPVTVKCRLGVDEQDVEAALDAVADAAFAEGADGLWVHARKAWLKGMSPKENREVPPLDHGRVRRLKERLPGRFIGLNGGLASLEEALPHLDALDGVMLGRAAWHTPRTLLDVDRAVYGEAAPPPDLFEVIAAMRDYAERELRRGTRLTAIVKPMLGLFHGLPGGRRWRQVLSVEGARPDAGAAVLDRALAAVADAAPAARAA